MTKEERLDYMRKNFPKYRRDENIASGGGAILSSSTEISDAMNEIHPFQEEQKDKRNIRGKINSDD
jgi:hypothetical protein